LTKRWPSCSAWQCWRQLHRPDAGRHGLPAGTRQRDDALESAAADNELVKFVNKVIIDAHNQKVSDIHIE
jgi:type II secretory ATPase GspE/PulE/Tfp pilus assembly ATPase PilB-like protein